MRPGIALRDSAEQRLAMARNAAVDAMFTPREARIEHLPDVQHLPWGPTSRGFRGLRGAAEDRTFTTGLMLLGTGVLAFVALRWLIDSAFGSGGAAPARRRRR